jgi:hemin uptake protein HemP
MTGVTHRPAADAQRSGVAPQKALTKVIDSRELLAGGRILRIQHGFEEYRLQITRTGKLILTK